jgi:hypothetical protein
LICCGAICSSMTACRRTPASFCVRCLNAHIPSLFSSRQATTIGSVPRACMGAFVGAQTFMCSINADLCR